MSFDNCIHIYMQPTPISRYRVFPTPQNLMAPPGQSLPKEKHGCNFFLPLLVFPVLELLSVDSYNIYPFVSICFHSIKWFWGSSIESFISSFSQVGFPGKRQWLACRAFIKEASWDLRLWKGGKETGLSRVRSETSDSTDASSGWSPGELSASATTGAWMAGGRILACPWGHWGCMPVRVISSCPHSHVNLALDRGCFSRKRLVLWVRVFVSAKKICPFPRCADCWGLSSRNSLSRWRSKSFNSEGSGQHSALCLSSIPPVDTPNYIHSLLLLIMGSWSVPTWRLLWIKLLWMFLNSLFMIYVFICLG